MFSAFIRRASKSRSGEPPFIDNARTRPTAFLVPQDQEKEISESFRFQARIDPLNSRGGSPLHPRHLSLVDHKFCTRLTLRHLHSTVTSKQ
ncbi:hypothetical protein TNCV_1594421 [Trichonephila clavipes]|nr:hypothetical protein TNCV_1594421 [Trichonephila clavipes]